MDQLGNPTNWYSRVGIKAIASAIAASGSMTQCDLCDNRLDALGWCAIFDALRDSPENKIAKWSLSNQIAQYGGRDEVAKSLAAYMAVSFSLKEVITLLKAFEQSPRVVHARPRG